MRRTMAMAVLAFLGFAASAAAQDADKKEIVGALTQFGEAWKKGDAAAVAAIFDEKAILTTAMGQTMRGRAAIQAGLEQVLAGPLKDTRFSTTAEGIEILKPGVAAIQSDQFLFRSGASAQAAAPRGISHSLIVWVKTDAGWKMKAVQGMLPAKPAE